MVLSPTKFVAFGSVHPSKLSDLLVDSLSDADNETDSDVETDSDIETESDVDSETDIDAETDSLMDMDSLSLGLSNGGSATDQEGPTPGFGSGVVKPPLATGVPVAGSASIVDCVNLCLLKKFSVL